MICSFQLVLMFINISKVISKDAFKTFDKNELDNEEEEGKKNTHRMKHQQLSMVILVLSGISSFINIFISAFNGSKK